MDLEGVFAQVSNQMRSDFAKAQSSLSHPGQKGQANEEAVREFFRQYLPKNLDIATGQLVDSQGGQSRQLDLIIADASNTPIFFQSGEIRVIPVECAYAVIEIKAYLDKPELEKAFQNMQSVKALAKTAFFSRRGDISHAHYLYGGQWAHWPIHHFVFAYDSPSLDSLVANLNELQAAEEVHKRIDSICVLDKGVIANLRQDRTFSGLPSPDSHPVAIFNAKPLLSFYALTSIILNQASMDPFNLVPYLKNMTF